MRRFRFGRRRARKPDLGRVSENWRSKAETERSRKGLQPKGEMLARHVKYGSAVVGGTHYFGCPVWDDPTAECTCPPEEEGDNEV